MRELIEKSPRSVAQQRFIDGLSSPRIPVNETIVKRNAPIQRYIDEQDAKKVFPKLQAFKTIDDNDKAALRDLGADDATVKKAIEKMMTELSGLTLGKDNHKIRVSELDMELSLSFIGKQLSFLLISPPGSTFHQRTFGLDRAITFEKGQKPSLYESRIDIKEEYQGGGAGTAIVRTGLDLANDLAIDLVTIEASDKGRYAWASLGFTPNAGEWDKIADGMIEAIGNYLPKGWHDETAKESVKPVLETVRAWVLDMEGNLRTAIRKGSPPDTFKFAFDDATESALIGALKSLFKQAGERIDDEAGENPTSIFGAPELSQDQLTYWGDFLSADGLASYLANQGLQRVLSEGLLKGVGANFSTGSKLGSTNLGPGQNKKDLTGALLASEIHARLMTILSPDTRSNHSLADVVDLANAVKGETPEAAEFIRELVARSATWKGAANLTDKTTQDRLKKTTGWKGR